MFLATTATAASPIPKSMFAPSSATVACGVTAPTLAAFSPHAGVTTSPHQVLSSAATPNQVIVRPKIMKKELKKKNLSTGANASGARKSFEKLKNNVSNDGVRILNLN